MSDPRRLDPKQLAFLYGWLTHAAGADVVTKITDHIEALMEREIEGAGLVYRAEQVLGGYEADGALVCPECGEYFRERKTPDE